MENLNLEQLEILGSEELCNTRGGSIWVDVFFDLVDILIDNYEPYVNRGCQGVYNEGCNVTMGLNGNTAFTGY